MKKEPSSCRTRIPRKRTMLLHRESHSAILIPLHDSWAVLCKEVFPTLEDQPVEWLGYKDASPTELINLLDNNYERHGRLSFTQLKAADQELVAEVRKACEQTGFSIFLVNVGKSETGRVDSGEDSDYSYKNLDIIYVILRHQLSFCPKSLNR